MNIHTIIAIITLLMRNNGTYLTELQIANQLNLPRATVSKCLWDIRRILKKSNLCIGYLASKPGPRGGYAFVNYNSQERKLTRVWVRHWRISRNIRPPQSYLL